MVDVVEDVPGVIYPFTCAPNIGLAVARNLDVFEYSPFAPGAIKVSVPGFNVDLH